MGNKILINLLILTGLSTYAAQAQEGWTLRQCIDTAKWARLPNLSGSASQNWSWGRTASPVDNTYNDINSGSSSFSLGTNIPLFTGLELPNQYELTKLNLKAAIEDLNKAKEDLAINVTSAYLQVLFNLELSKVAQSQVGLSKEQLNRITRLHEVGKASPAEVAEAKARVAQDEMSAVQADNNYRLALLDLSQLNCQLRRTSHWLPRILSWSFLHVLHRTIFIIRPCYTSLVSKQPNTALKVVRKTSV